MLILIVKQNLMNANLVLEQFLLLPQATQICATVSNILAFSNDIVYLLLNVRNLTRKIVPFLEVLNDCGFISAATSAATTRA